MLLYLPQFSLQRFNTLAAPCVADFYVSVKSLAELKEASKFAAENNLPLLVLGGGSNIVLHDNFQGLAIHLRLSGVELLDETDDYVDIKFAAGENWHETVSYCLTHGYYGLENLSLIPGTVGAAPIQNIGAYGVEVKDLITEVSTIEIKSGIEVLFTNESCRFAYRDSVFKNNFKDQFIITSVTFRLSKMAKVNISYPALGDYFAGQGKDDITPEDVSEAVINIRQSKLPDPKTLPNVGSFFKNPIISIQQYNQLLETFPNMPSYPAGDNQRKLAAAWLIDQSGWKGQSLDGVAVHQHQALVLTNPEKLSSDKVLALAEKIQLGVKNKFGVELEIEPRIY